MEIVDAKNLTRVFDHKKKKIFALRDVNLKIKRGEIFGLLGPNGAGKTTFINILGGVLTPTEGTVEIFGKDVKKYRDQIVEDMNVGSGESQFHWALTVQQILIFYSMVYGFEREEGKKKVSRLVNEFEIKDILNKKIGWLSSGQRMRVVLCKALLNDPKFLMLDEPTLRLDPDIAKKTRELILKVNKEHGATILLASHYMTEVEQLCKRIAFLDKGQIIDIGKIDKVKSKSFTEFRILIKVKNLKNITSLKKMGFDIQRKNRTISKVLKNDEELSSLLNKLARRGYDLLDIETKKPTLEDYFLKMVENGKEEGG